MSEDHWALRALHRTCSYTVPAAPQIDCRPPETMALDHVRNNLKRERSLAELSEVLVKSVFGSSTEMHRVFISFQPVGIFIALRVATSMNESGATTGRKAISDCTKLKTSM